jgi:hypothetical protein
MTNEKLIQLISASIVSVTVVFSIVVVIRELMKPGDMFEKIVSAECSDLTAIDASLSGESELREKGGDCILVTAELLKTTPLFEKISVFGSLDGFNYLYIGKKGVLIKKSEESNAQNAKLILDCLKGNECPKKPVSAGTVTIMMQNSSGKVEISETYSDIPVHRTALNFKKLLKEISGIKKLDDSKLRLTLVFHRSYAYIEDKTPEFVNSLLKKGVDGLYLKSRGAKIRVLPFEYSDNPVNVADRKGRQYGLDKEEYKKDEATFYHYRTEQFIEKNGEMVPWLGIYGQAKSSYSDNLATLLISKHLRSTQKKGGHFPSEIEIFSGEEKKEKASTSLLISAAITFLKAKEALNDSSFLDLALKTSGYVIGKELNSDVSKGYLFDFIELCGDECQDAAYLAKKKELAQYFGNIKNVFSMIDNDPVFTGVFIQAFSKAFEGKEKEVKTAELLDAGFNKFSGLKESDKLRFISYLTTAQLDKGSESGRKISSFLNDQTDFLKAALFDDRGFSDLSGSFRTTGKKNNMPDTALSLLLAAGLSRAVNYGYHNEAILDMEAGIGNYLRFLTVTDDDFPNWGDTKAKTAVQGGVRNAPGTETVKFANSSRALEYFVNRVAQGRTR